MLKNTKGLVNRICLILNWINDPIVRKMSFNKIKSLWMSMKKFFNSAINDDNILFWVYEYKSFTRRNDKS